MRERLALLVLAAVAAVVLVLAAWFAQRHNPDETEPAAAADQTLARGRELFADLQCQLCHSLGGAGNPRLPLDGVGARLEPADIRDSIRGEYREVSATAKERKLRYRELPGDDLDALVVFLAGQRETGAP